MESNVQFDADGLTVNQIIPGIYLGPALSRDGQRVLIDNGIRNVINVTMESDLNFWSGETGEITYKQIPVIDENHISIIQYFDEAYEFVKSCADKNEKVYIHCHGGKSRSPTITIYAIMRLLNVPLREAHDLVLRGRSCISPGIGFFQQLVDSEMRIRGEISYPYDEYVVDKLVRFFGGAVSSELAKETYIECERNGAMATNVLMERVWGPGKVKP